MKPSIDPDILTVPEAAAFLRVGRNQLYDWIAQGEIPHRRIGKSIRLSKASIAKWFDGGKW